MQLVSAFLIGLALALAPVAAVAERRSLAHTIYYQDLGYAIGGYDPVSFFRHDEPLQGQTTYAVMWKGVTWLFSSAEHQAIFEANPRAYAPQFGGYCAYGVSVGKLVSGDPHAFEIRDGALFMLHSPEVQLRWNGARQERLNAAQANWPEILRD